MPHRDEPLLERQLHLVGQLEQPHVVRDGRAFLAHLFREGVLRQVALVDQALHSERDLYGVEILALDILHEGHGVQVLVVHLADIGREARQVGALRRTPAAFAADDDIFPVAGFLDRDGLDDPQLADRVGQFVERLLVELRTRLRGVGSDLRDVDLGHLAHRRELGVDGVGAEYGVQSAP